MRDGYAHDSNAFDEHGEPADRNAEADPNAVETDERDPLTVHPDEVDREFDWRGWTLVAGIFVSFIVIPGIIYAYPHVGPMFGLTFWDTYLALPMIPAVLLAILAVWATTRP